MQENFYDNYEFIAKIELSLQPELLQYAMAAGKTAEYKNVRGMSTGNRTRELETDNWQYAVVYYDDLGRTVQTVKTNHLGGATRTSTNLRFNGTARDVHIEHDFGGKAESMREHYH
ncbi:MAG: hypothetical protein ILA04_08575, partial [Prevotella sp.]|nr:hypothetical protein [Prevotella sp.]